MEEWELPHKSARKTNALGQSAAPKILAPLIQSLEKAEPAQTHGKPKSSKIPELEDLAWKMHGEEAQRANALRKLSRLDVASAESWRPAPTSLAGFKYNETEPRGPVKLPPEPGGARLTQEDNPRPAQKGKNLDALLRDAHQNVFRFIKKKGRAPTQEEYNTFAADYLKAKAAASAPAPEKSAPARLTTPIPVERFMRQASETGVGTMGAMRDMLNREKPGITQEGVALAGKYLLDKWGADPDATVSVQKLSHAADGKAMPAAEQYAMKAERSNVPNWLNKNSRTPTMVDDGGTGGYNQSKGSAVVTKEEHDKVVQDYISALSEFSKDPLSPKDIYFKVTNLLTVTEAERGPSSEKHAEAVKSQEDPGAFVGDAPKYKEYTGEGPNCYAYVLGREVDTKPGFAIKRSNPSLYGKEEDVYRVAAYVIADVDALGGSARVLKGSNDTILPDEYRIAVRVMRKPYVTGAGVDQYYDYHFMVQTKDGRWAEKKNGTEGTVRHSLDEDPHAQPWPKSESSFYDSDIVFLAIYLPK